MRFDKMTLGRQAKELGFPRDTYEKVRRLMEILMFVSQDPFLSEHLALKGGTAINLTVFDLPRLSVDIDLDLVSDASREEMQEIRRVITERIEKYMQAAGYTSDDDEVIGYAMFSRFHIEGKYTDELLILTPVAVKTSCQRQHISRDLIEYGFRVAAEMGFKAVLVEGDPKNYVPRGFKPSWKYGITAGPAIHLPHPDCLMVKELENGALNQMEGQVDYGIYESLHEG